MFDFSSLKIHWGISLLHWWYHLEVFCSIFRNLFARKSFLLMRMSRNVDQMCVILCCICLAVTIIMKLHCFDSFTSMKKIKSKNLKCKAKTTTKSLIQSNNTRKWKKKKLHINICLWKQNVAHLIFVCQFTFQNIYNTTITNLIA